MNLKSRWMLLALTALASPCGWAKDYPVTVGGFVDGGGYYGGTTDVLMFQPSSLTIQAGDTVTFTNAGGTHNVVSDTAGLFRCANGCDGSGGNGSPAAGWRVTIPFNNVGTFGYHCEIHQSMGMKGSIVVTPSPQATFSITAGITGTWVNSSPGFSGFNIEVPDVATHPNYIFTIWYLFDTAGKQYILTAQGDYISGSNSVTLPVVYTSGGFFPPDPTPTKSNPWGSLTLTFSSCTAGTIAWTPSVNGFSAGSMNITRLTQVNGLACP